MPLRIALVGTGWVNEQHAAAIATCDGAEIAGAVGSSVQKADDFVKQLGTGIPYVSVDELAADQAVDAVVIGTPNALHAPHGITLLEAGKHLLVDKPMAATLEQARAMRAAAEANDRVLMIGHMFRFDAHARLMREQIAAGTIGRVVKTKAYAVHVLWGPSGWFTERARSGGGALIDMGVHAIDTTRFVLGDPQPREVYARVSTAYGDYDVDDVGVVVITWEGGIISVIECGWWNVHADGEKGSLQLHGTEGYARLYPTEMHRLEGGALVELPLPIEGALDRDEKYRAQMRAFVDAATTGRLVDADAHVGEVVMRIIDAAYRSATSGKSVHLTD